MSLLLTLEQGELVIGRSPDADWQIDDPDMFVSRAHCKITSGQDGYIVVDTSSSGLFIDDAGSALGSGNSAQLRHGMRLRLGDYVVSVELQPTEAHLQHFKPTVQDVGATTGAFGIPRPGRSRRRRFLFDQDRRGASASPPCRSAQPVRASRTRRVPGL